LASAVCAASFAQTEDDFLIDGRTSTGYVGRATDVVIPTDIGGIPITNIGNSAFRKKQLTSVTIPYGVITIGNDAFSDNRLTSLIIPDSVTIIGDRAFNFNRLTSLTLGNSVTYIGVRAFCGGSNLSTLIIPDSVIIIEEMAFFWNELNSLTIGNGVKYIRAKAFALTLLTSVTFEVDGIKIDPDNFYGNLLTVYANGGAGSYTKPDFNSVIWTKE
jgi:hypothetical protein